MTAHPSPSERDNPAGLPERGQAPPESGRPRTNGPFEKRLKAIRFVSWVGLFFNVLLSLIKIIIGTLANSRALIADGIHGISDIVTNVVIIIGARYWLSPPDDDHPYGHERLETFVSLIIGVLLAFAGLGIGYDALMRLLEGGTRDEAVGLAAFFVALISIIVKEGLYRWTAAKGRELESESIEASAQEHRADVFATMPVLLAVAVALWIPGLAIIDVVGALVVAILIQHSAWQIYIPAANSLLDRGADKETRNRIASLAAQHPGVHGVHALRTRFMGKALHIDMHIVINKDLSIETADKLAHDLEHSLRSDSATQALGVRVSSVLVHVDPDE